MAKTTSPTKRKAVIYKSGNGQFYYCLIGDNGKVLSVSENMKRRRSCVDVCQKYFPGFKIVFQ